MSARGVWVYVNGEAVPKHLYHRPVPARSDLSAPMLIRDTIEPTLNHADGRRYDSKRAYERAVRAAGCEIIGNETPKASPRPQLDDPIHDIKRALETAPSTAKRKKRGRI